MKIRRSKGEEIKKEIEKIPDKEATIAWAKRKLEKIPTTETFVGAVMKVEGEKELLLELLVFLGEEDEKI